MIRRRRRTREIPFSFDPRSYMLPKPPMPMMSPDGSLTPRGGAARASPRGNR